MKLFRIIREFRVILIKDIELFGNCKRETLIVVIIVLFPFRLTFSLSLQLVENLSLRCFIVRPATDAKESVQWVAQ